MKNQFIKTTALLLLVLLVIFSCSSSSDIDEEVEETTGTLHPAFAEFDTVETTIYLSGADVVIETTGLPNHTTPYCLIDDHTVILVEYARSQKDEILPSIGNRLRRIRDRRYGRTYVALYACDGREMPDEDDEWAAQPEEATRFGKVVRGGKRDDDDEEDE